MKHIFLLFVVGLLTGTATSQIQVPQPSPSSTIEQEVGLTNVTIKYSRPGMRDRTIFGDLVPYGERWRTGANNNTTISFDTKVTIEGKDLEAGTYAIYTIPQEDSWEVIFYSESNNWGLPEQWEESKVALKATAEVHDMPMPMETFTILIDEISHDSAALNFIWEETVATLRFQVPADEQAMASIDRVMNGPTATDYFSAASYFHDTKKDLDKAYEWIQKAVEMSGDEAFWIMRRQSLIEADLGMTKEAIASARKSLTAAEKAGNKDYVKLNQDSLEEWGAQ